jgi:hypothetical protein
MFHLVRRLPAPALVISIVALVLALGGVASAGPGHGITNLTVVRANASGTGDSGGAIARCPTGDVPTGGGLDYFMSSGTASSESNSPFFNIGQATPIGWIADVHSTDPNATVNVTVSAVCVPGS